MYAGLGWDVLRGGEQGRVGLLLISPDASVVCVFLPMPIGGQARYFLFAVFTKSAPLDRVGHRVAMSVCLS